MEYSGYGEIEVELPVKLGRIIEIEIDWKPNAHGIARVITEIGEEEAEGAIEGQWSKESIKIKGKEAGVLFVGRAESIKISVENGYHQIELGLISGSKVMDEKRKSRSFQDSTKSYSQIVEEVVKKNEGGDVICTKGKEEKIERPLIQYEETDWEFLKRLASEQGGMVLADVKEDRPRIWYGMRKGKEIGEELGEEAYEVEKKTEEYYEMGGEEGGAKEKSYLRYRVESGENYEIGDKTRYRKKAMTICEKRVRIRRGEIVYQYVLSDPAGYSEKRRGNERIQGVGIEGTIIERKEDSMKVHLSIDEEQEKEKAWWYPYTPVSSNQLYAMPVEGEKVRLIIGEREEGSSYLRESIRCNGESCPETGKPENRWYRTEAEKIMTLQPGELQMSTPGNEMTEEDKEGITLKTGKKVKIEGKAGVEISGKKVEVKGSREILLHAQKAGGKFLVKNEFNTLGSKAIMQTIGSPAKKQAEKVKVQKNPIQAVKRAIGAIAAVKVMKTGKVEAGKAEFEGKVRKETIRMADIPMEQVRYIKREKEGTRELRKEFGKEREAFVKGMSEDKEALREAGMSEKDIRDMEAGYVPDGYQVHHKLPLDDSGTNREENLILIKNDPYHQSITNYQREQTKGMKAGEEREIMWPMPEGKIYPEKG